MQHFKHLGNETAAFMGKLFTDRNTNIVLNNKDFRCHFASVLHRMLCADDTNLRNKAPDILEKVFSRENIGIILENKYFILL